MRVSKLVYLDKKELLMSPQNRRYLLVAAGAVVLLLAIPLAHRTVAADATLKPAEEATVEAPEDGTVAEVLVHEGDAIAKGQPLFRLSSPTVDAEAARWQAQRDRFAGRSSGDRSVANATMAYQAESRASAAQIAFENAEYRQRFLLVRSPIDGRVLTRRTEDLEGRFVAVGYPLVRIGDSRRIVAEVPVSERLFEYLHVGSAVSAHARSRASKTYSGSIVRISPASMNQPKTANGKDPDAPTTQPDRFVAVSVFDNADGTLLPGTAVRLKIRSSRESLAKRIWDLLWRWTRTVLW